MKSKSDSLLEFFGTINRLKEIKRTGWIERGVKGPESVADHGFGTAVMAFFLAGELKVDKSRLVKMLLVHDLHESISGDLILDFGRFGSSFKGLGGKEKKEREGKAFRELAGIAGEKRAKEFEVLWNEFEERKTREAKIAREIDVLEMLFQAAEYERKKNFRKPVWGPWIESNRKRIRNPMLKKILAELEARMESACRRKSRK